MIKYCICCYKTYNKQPLCQCSGIIEKKKTKYSKISIMSSEGFTFDSIKETCEFYNISFRQIKKSLENFEPIEKVYFRYN